MNSLVLAASGLQNISDNDGIAIALTGITIVFAALILITVFISLLPKILAAVNEVFPEPVPKQAVAAASSPVAAATNDDDLVAAAIAVAHHAHNNS
ncbi:MAG: hypothetical protein CMJ78_20235 [Planctomycetaceae bacterium]|nr:hypothetical protein [Planctomycetaceae bacterium]